MVFTCNDGIMITVRSTNSRSITPSTLLSFNTTLTLIFLLSFWLQCSKLYIYYNSQALVASKDKIKHPQCPRQANFMFTLILKIADVREPSGMHLRGRNASDSCDHVKIADRLGCLGWSVHTGRNNPRRRKIVKIPDSYVS